MKRALIAVACACTMGLSVPASAQDAELACVPALVGPVVSQALVDDLLADVGMGDGTSIDYQPVLNDAALKCILEHSVPEAAMDNYIEGSIAAIALPLLREQLVGTSFPLAMAQDVSKAMQADPSLDVDAYVESHPSGINEEIERAALESGIPSEHVMVLIGTYVAIEAMYVGARAELSSN